MSFEQPNFEKPPVSPEKPEQKEEAIMEDEKMKSSEYTDLLLAKINGDRHHYL